MSVRERLASLGRDLGQFNQTDFSNDFQMEGVDISDGYCAGVCLDWTRRVLLSGTGRDQRFLNYSNPKNALVSATTGETRQTQTLQRMATAYEGQGASYVTTTRKSELLPKLTALLRVPEQTVNFRGARFTGVPVPNETAELINHFWVVEPGLFDMQKQTAGIVSHQKIQSWLTALGTRVDPQHSPRAAGGREWGQFARELDDRFSQSKRKTFGRLRVVRSSNQQTYGSPGEWHGELLPGGLMDNCCTIAAMGAHGDSGHAVAIHQHGSDYRFFDPNFGVFDYSLVSLKAAVQHLFWTPYFQNETGLDLDLPVYRRRTSETDEDTGAAVARDAKPWTRMSYTIFAANG